MHPRNEALHDVMGVDPIGAWILPHRHRRNIEFPGLYSWYWRGARHWRFPIPLSHGCDTSKVVPEMAATTAFAKCLHLHLPKNNNNNSACITPCSACDLCHALLCL